MHHIIPCSNDSNKKHDLGVQSTITFHLENVENLITNDKNSCPYIHTITKDTEKNRILALTETELKKSKHPDTEIKKYFQGHNIVRQDREEKESEVAKADPNHLSKSGGCILISSNGIPLKKVDKDSNGNVEFLIAEAETLNAAIVLIYNPPSNFCLPKFKEAMARINREKEEPLDIILAGDLNFSSEIVAREKSDIGVTPNPSGGSIDRKKGFEILNEIADDNGLTQLVDKITHGKDVLDLVYTNNPRKFSSCKRTILVPESDHHMVSFEMTTSIQECILNSKSKDTPQIPKIASYNIRSANKEKLLKALSEIKWRQLLGQISNIRNLELQQFCSRSSASIKQPKWPNLETQRETSIRKPTKNSITYPLGNKN